MRTYIKSCIMSCMRITAITFSTRHSILLTCSLRGCIDTCPPAVENAEFVVRKSIAPGGTEVLYGTHLAACESTKVTHEH